METCTIRGDDVALQALVAGDGPLLVLLHGFPETPEGWRPQVEALSALRQVVAPWQRGYGASDHPDGAESYRIERLCADVFAVADQFGATRFALAGHDWGGIVAWWCAALRPDRVEHLCIVNAPHPTLFQRALDSDAGQRAASGYIVALVDPQFEALALHDGGGAFWQALFGAHLAAGEIGRAERDAMLADWQRPGTLTAMTDWYRASPFSFPGGGGPFAARVPPMRIDVPTTLIWGDGDPVLLPVLLDGLEELVPDLTIHHLAAGHGVLREQPETVTAILAAALNN